jgi:hypothetical protein
MAFKKAKNTAILNDEKVTQKGEDFNQNFFHNPKAQVLELPNSDYINTGLNLTDLRGYNLKSISIVKGRNTVIEIFR